MTLPYGTPDDVLSIEESEEIAAADEARAELLIDGPAPSRDAILETMREHDAPASRAARALLGSVDLDGPTECAICGDPIVEQVDEDGTEVYACGHRWDGDRWDRLPGYLPGGLGGDVGDGVRLARSRETGSIYRLSDWVEHSDGRLAGRVVEVVHEGGDGR